MRERSDEDLMNAYRLGEASAFDELYARHSPKVLAYLLRRCRGEAEARDVFQSAFLKLHRCRADYRPGSPFLPWLFTICRSELLDCVKRSYRRHEAPVAEVPEAVAASPPPEAPALRLDTLPAPQKEALALRYQKELSFAAIAQALGTSQANARQLVSRALRSLRGTHGK